MVFWVRSINEIQEECFLHLKPSTYRTLLEQKPDGMDSVYLKGCELCKHSLSQKGVWLLFFNTSISDVPL